MATWMDQVARGWLIYELTDSAFQLGLVRGIQAIPILLLSPLAGSTADRYSRKMQVLVAQLVDGLLYGVIALLILTGQIQPWHVYVTAFGMSYCPRHLPRPSANGDSNLLALRLPWPDNGYLSYDPCGAVGRGYIHRHTLIARWSAVGSGIDEHRRRARRDGHIRNYAARSAHPIAQRFISFIREE